ncbi:alpha/beta-hydrolase family protein [soil metagenome]
MNRALEGHKTLRPSHIHATLDPMENLRVRLKRVPTYDFWGIAVGVVFFCWSLTPSLLPRSWLLQGVVSGVVTALGYGLGRLAAHLIGTMLGRDPAPTTRRAAWRGLLVVALVGVLASLHLGSRWQQQIHVLLGFEEPPSFSYLGTAALAGVVFAALVQFGRGLRWLYRRLANLLHSWIPRPVAHLVSGVLGLALIVGLLDGIVFVRFLEAADNVSRTVDDAISEDISPPLTPARSGGPGSGVAWEELGSKGRDFIAGGPTLAELEAFHGSPASEPVRIYVGLDAAASEHERAAVAAAELERAGGFDRSVVAVIVPTGTGWVNPNATAALEFLHNGDSALVAMQYGYLPSWLSYMVDGGRARDAGRELFNQVYDRWSQLPEADRPLLVVYGESLGSLGSEAAFSGEADLVIRADGALWVGPTNFNSLWRQFTSRRDPGSLERLPIFDGGQTVRFAATSEHLLRDVDEWHFPRVAYLQNPSDPVVWWSPNLLFRRPDWLREPRGHDVLDSVRWFPLVTFSQMTIDLLAGYSIEEEDYGHRYARRVVEAWAAIVPPEGWTDADTARLKGAMGHGP